MFLPMPKIMQSVQHILFPFQRQKRRDIIPNPWVSSNMSVHQAIFPSSWTSLHSSPQDLVMEGSEKRHVSHFGVCPTDTCQAQCFMGFSLTSRKAGSHLLKVKKPQTRGVGVPDCKPGEPCPSQEHLLQTLRGNLKWGYTSGIWGFVRDNRGCYLK